MKSWQQGRYYYWWRNWSSEVAEVPQPVCSQTRIHHHFQTLNSSSCFWSPTFWHQGPVSWKSTFPLTEGRGMVSGWFKNVTFTIHFISIIITSALPQIIRPYIPETGDSCFREFSHKKCLSCWKFTRIIPLALRILNLRSRELMVLVLIYIFIIWNNFWNPVCWRGK